MELLQNGLAIFALHILGFDAGLAEAYSLQAALSPPDESSTAAAPIKAKKIAKN